MKPDYIDIHTHSPRSSGHFVMNVFAQDLVESFNPSHPCTIGLHPWHLDETDCTLALQKIERHAGNKFVLGIGECGLDKNIQTPFSFQEEQFLKQLKLSEKIEKPAIIHCVKAYSEILHIRKKNHWQMPWLFHWFNASTQVATDLLQTGCYLSFGRSLLQENGKNASVFKEVPLDRAFFETDDAEISIESVYERAAFIKNIPVDDLKEKIYTNFITLFKNV